jgi:acyl carrier protein
MPLTRERIVEYLVASHDLDRGELDDEAALFSSHALDSFAMVDLMVFVEKEAGIRIRASEVTLDNLDSIAKILRFAEARAASVP